jgi:hypothetical protein
MKVEDTAHSSVRHQRTILNYYLDLFFHHHFHRRRYLDSIIETGPLNWTWDFARDGIDPKLHLGHVSIWWCEDIRRHDGPTVCLVVLGVAQDVICPQLLMWRQKIDGNKLTTCTHKHVFFFTRWESNNMHTGNRTRQTSFCISQEGFEIRTTSKTHIYVPKDQISTGELTK